MEAIHVAQSRVNKERRKPKKTLNACQRCRNRKIKCSGVEPCQNCASKRLRCNFEKREKRIIISEQYVLELQQRIRELEAPSCQSRTSENLDTTQVTNEIHPVRYFLGKDDQTNLPTTEIESLSSKSKAVGRVIDDYHPSLPRSSQSQDQPIINPLRASKSQLLFGDHGYFRYLGHSSTWSFSRQMRGILNSSGVGSPLHDRVSKGDGVLYDVSWKCNTADLSQVDLPPQDIAEYFATTVVLYLGPMYYCYDHESFMKNLRGFYADEGAHTQKPSRLWHIQMLLVFACGKSILAREAGPSGHAGTNFFRSAIEGMPDIRALQNEPILALEVLCLLSLFLEASDIRSGAWGYIGQAARIALQQGMNREFESGILTECDIRHRTKLWWTVYIIDRKITYLMGTPLMLHDLDITIPKPAFNSVDDSTSAFSFHIHLSSQLGHVLKIVYGIQGILGTNFISGVQSILQNLADIYPEMNKRFKVDLPGTVSREAASLHMLYNQCIIVAIRPLLLCLLENKLKSKHALSLSDAVVSLLKVCVESAVQVIKIIQTLKNQTLIDLFLPYDLDALFSSAFVIVLIDSVIPAAEEQWGIEEAFSVFDHMIRRGVTSAVVYKEHLVEMNDFRWILRRGEWRGVESPPTPMEPMDIHQTSTDVSSSPTADSSTIHGEQSLTHPDQELIWSWMSTESNDLGMLHSDTMQSAITGLDAELMATSLDFDASNQWLWGNFISDHSIL